MILVSSCLLGIYAKYDGTLTNKNSLLLKYKDCGKYIPVCPEQLGGLCTPRFPVEIMGGTGEDVLAGSVKAKNDHGEDVTPQFIRGAQQVLYITKILPIKAAILKERSPSCGVNLIYDGTFQHVVREGRGVTAAILKQYKIPVFSEGDLTEELLQELLL